MNLEQLKDHYDLVLARVCDFQFIEERVKSFSLLFKLEDFGNQAIAGYQLNEWSENLKRMIPSAPGLDMIEQLKEVFAVDDLTEAKNQIVYCVYRKRHTIGCLIAGVSRLSMDYITDQRNYFLVDDWRSEWLLEGRR